MSGWTRDRVPPGSSSTGLPDSAVQEGSGTFTPIVPADTRGDIDVNEIRCALCRAIIKDYTKVKQCWSCEQTNFIGNP